MIGILGSINLDLISYCDELPNIGETILGKKFISAPGGKGANQALAAARAGGQIKFYGAVGNDGFAKIALSEFNKEAIDLKGIKIVEQATGTANIIVDANGNNIIVVASGANAEIDKKMAKKTIANMNEGDILLLNQEIPFDVILLALELAKKAKILTILNIAPIICGTKQLAALADIVIANQSEFNELVDKEISFDKIQSQIKKYALYNEQTLVVTLGENGAIYANKKDCQIIKAPKVTSIDSVGAGDCFCGVLASYLDEGFSMKQATNKAIIAGSLAVLKTGAQTSFPYKEEIESYG